MSLLEINKLKTYYSTYRGYIKAVDGVSLKIRSGEALGLVGESGCGKSTLALAIMHLLPSNARIIEGSIFFDGQDISNIDEDLLRKEYRWKKMAIVFQEAMNALNPVFKIGDQITEGIITHEHMPLKEAIDRARSALSIVGLDPELLVKYPHELSGGMRQRVMIAMALSCNPNFLIADEPTTALDVLIQAQIMKLLKNLQKKLDLSMMLITHDLSIVAETCDKCAIMYAGKLVEYSDIVTIFKKPLHPYTKGLIQAFPNLRGDLKKLISIKGSPPNLLDPPSGCVFHPRCSLAKNICKERAPILVESASGHTVACHLL